MPVIRWIMNHMVIVFVAALIIAGAVYQDEISDRTSAFTHVRLNIFPDGGVSRMRIFGYPEAGAN